MFPIVCRRLVLHVPGHILQHLVLLIGLFIAGGVDGGKNHREGLAGAQRERIFAVAPGGQVPERGAQPGVQPRARQAALWHVVVLLEQVTGGNVGCNDNIVDVGAVHECLEKGVWVPQTTPLDNEGVCHKTVPMIGPYAGLASTL